MSTVLGFIPFVIGNPESFWFNLAVGIIGGMTMSVLTKDFRFVIRILGKSLVVLEILRTFAT